MPRTRQPPGGAFGSAVYAPPGEAADDDGGRHGDSAGEHLYMKRGRWSAWPYVVIAFLMEAALIGCVLGMPIAFGLAAATGNEQVGATAGLVVGLLAGFGGAYFVFRDRWRCNEAFSSRFCVGLVNISIMFVPLVSFVYANVRGFKKLAGS
ncbi:MAG: hypothetical protein R3B70_33780 [Polyangiaceae bacterium]